MQYFWGFFGHKTDTNLLQIPINHAVLVYLQLIVPAEFFGDYAPKMVMILDNYPLPVHHE